MAAPKRKAETNTGISPKKEAGAPADRSAKRQRKSDAADAGKPAKVATAKPEKAAPKSVFKNEEKAFPRGGASVLTPLEHKQIQIKANQDVLFEQAGIKRSGNDDMDMSDIGSEAGSEQAAKTTKKRKSKKSKKAHEEEKENVIKVESLSFKRIIPGMIILGQVSEITSRDLVLALPNNLVGFVPLTAISDKFTAKIEKLLEEADADAGEDDESDDFEDVDLDKMFKVGQYLRACVTSAADEVPTSGTAKKRIELSIQPALVNRGLAKSSITVNGTIQASVASNEDHGLIMDMGLEEPGLKGFLPKSEIGKDVDHSKVQEGTVFLCTVSRLNSDGRVITLSADYQKTGNLKKLAHVTDAPTVDVFLPGTAVDMLVTDTTPTTVTGKIMGMLDATADAVHSGAADRGEDMSEKYKIGSRVKARIICTFPNSEPKKVGVSLLDHVVSLSTRVFGKAKESKDPLSILPISGFVEEAKVTRVEPSSGVYLDIGVKGVPGFAHISRLSDENVDRPSSESGAFKIGSKHRTRVLGYNPLDGLYQLSLEKKVLEQPFLRVQDVKVGQVVKGKVEKLIVDKKGHTSVLVSLAEGIRGLVSERHLADVRLQHPERKFRDGATVTARVLSVDVEKRHVKLTLKKSLVNSDVEPWVDYSTLSVNDRGPGTLVEVKPAGAKVRFYGPVKAWLPVAEMSEAYIEDATKHFQVGQVVNVRIIAIDPEHKRMIVSCKDPEAVDADKEATFKSLNLGDIVRGTVLEKTDDMATVDMGHGVKGLLRIGHMTDGSEKKDKATMARLRVGGPVEDVVVIDKRNKQKAVILSNKPSLRKDAQNKKLVTSFEDVKTGDNLHGFVRKVMPDRVYVEFGGGVVGLLFQSQLPDDMKNLADFGLRQDQSITARVSYVDEGQARFWLSMRADAETTAKPPTQGTVGEATVNAVDKNIKSTTDLHVGDTTQVRIKSVKSTQLNVQVADNVQGRISVAEIFNSWDDIKDKRHPLAQFKANEILPVKVLGLHDARNHRFLPITHRQGKVPTFELTAKTNTDTLSLENITPGSSHIAFINNIADRYVWVNLSANVRGRIELLELSDDLSLLANVEDNFPIGCALRVRVKAVDVEAGRLDLTATSTESTKQFELKDLKEGLVLPARVTKVHDSSIVVKISENIAGPIYLEQLADDYDKAKPKNYKLGDIVRVCVLSVDVPNKKVWLSARPSRVLSSSLPIRDPEIKDISQLKVHQVVRGFVKKIDAKGVFVRLGPHVDAFVKISNLSDEYIKDWKTAFQVDQLVTGKIIAANPGMRNAQMTLKKSVVEGEYVPQLEFSDMEVGQIVTAKVRRVEDFGVFLVVDNSRNVSGLCHISQVADSRVQNLKALYKEGDAVKAKVLEVDPEKRRVNFGLKYSYIKGSEEDDDEEGSSGEEEDDASAVSEMDVDGVDEDMRSVKSVDDDDEAMQDAEENEGDDEDPSHMASTTGLKTSGFDWTGATLDLGEQKAADESSSDEESKRKKKKHKKATIQEDRTGDLDAHGPQSVADYERLLLGQPNSAELWVRYIVFQRDLNEIEKARQIARRALSVINPREEKEKLDVWTALLHLENDFSSDDTVEETFKEACQNNDSREIHERMIKIYVSSGKLDKADNLYQAMTKNKEFTPTPSLWLSYATFLMSTLQPPSPARARALLNRAMQSVPESEHRYLTSKFAALEFKSPNGNPEHGRTIFEGLICNWPKKGDLWDMYVELEKAHGIGENVRALYERMVKQKMKRKRASVVFRRWADWEENIGNSKGAGKVRAMEKDWMEKKLEEKEKEE
ncbi:rRNA biogenesis protein-like protein RRP5 [Westerdykella ornata]|uniref:rRNA biogenesis protein RRP5 n=1 Tax=Westerdykella ornata TaxID=318751 RepID=A0A6A6JIV2_WESOR|nr:rRNA biogenesis protein-like protein RRP5 [Westerdykella ornata]KAF2276377.1 rRNA biogenesis protein-like protein RRP5 [Westerdykella ornata]